MTTAFIASVPCAQRVDSLDDLRVQDYRNVRDADLRRRRGLFMAEGRLGVRRLIESSRFRARSVLATPTALAALGDAIRRLPAEVPVYVAKPEVLNGVVGFDLHRGCLAVGEPERELSIDALLAAAPEASLLVVLEGLSNPDNVGGVFRNASAFGADAVVLCPRCCDPLYRKALRVSMGACLEVPFARAEAWPDALVELKAQGYQLVALDPHASSLEHARLETAKVAGSRMALLLGTEAAGLSAATSAHADLRVRIDMAPGVDSLNVATASGIALHHFARDRAANAGRLGEAQSCLHS